MRTRTSTILAAFAVAALGLGAATGCGPHCTKESVSITEGRQAEVPGLPPGVVVWLADVTTGPKAHVIVRDPSKDGYYADESNVTPGQILRFSIDGVPYELKVVNLDDHWITAQDRGDFCL